MQLCVDQLTLVINICAIVLVYLEAKIVTICIGNKQGCNFFGGLKKHFHRLILLTKIIGVNNDYIDETLCLLQAYQY